MAVETKVKISGVEEISPELRKVVADLDAQIPSGSSAVVYIELTRRSSFAKPEYSIHSNAVSEVLRQTPEVCAIFPRRTSRKKSTFTSPNTWLVGAIDESEHQASKWGLFLRLNGFYDDREVRAALGARRIDHTSLDVNKLTGRIPGTISPILERPHLQACAVVNFDRFLVGHLKYPDSIVDFPLGNSGHFYVARGREFLTGYARLMETYGILSNLQAALKVLINFIWVQTESSQSSHI